MLVFVLILPTRAQRSSLLVLRDLHYDLLEDHDLEPYDVVDLTNLLKP